MIIVSPFDVADSGSVWDGLSLNSQRTSLDDNQAPDSRDYDRVIAEVVACENALVDLVGSSGAGTTPATGVSVEERGAGFPVHQTTITIPAVDLTTTDDATHGAFASLELYDFPTNSNIQILGCSGSIALAAGAGGLADTAAIIGGVGTSAAAQSAGDGTLATAEKNIGPQTTLTLSGGTKVATALADFTTNLITTTGSKKAYLNFQCPTAGSSATDTLTVTGTVTLTWIKL